MGIQWGRRGKRQRERGQDKYNYHRKGKGTPTWNDVISGIVFRGEIPVSDERRPKAKYDNVSPEKKFYSVWL